MADADYRAYIRDVPKVELHVHLEGGVRPARLLRILRRHALHPELRRTEDLAFLFQHRDFAEFLEHFRFVVTALRDVQDVHDVAQDLFEDLAAQNVHYAEVIFSAAIFTRMGLPLDELLAAVSEAADRAPAPAAAAAFPAAFPTTSHMGAAAGSAPAVEPVNSPPAPRPRFNFVIDVVRNFGAEAAVSLVADLAQLAHPRVVGIHLGGDEVRFPARLFAPAFACAREAGLGCAAHAGEAAGADSVRDAVEVLGVQRVGHGIGAVGDADLLKRLAEGGITLEVCPTSNLRTGVVASLATHPLPQLLAAGVPVTLGADDPAYFSTDLTRELQSVAGELGLGPDAVDEFAAAGLRAAFLPAPARQVRIEAWSRARDRARAAHGLPPGTRPR